MASKEITVRHQRSNNYVLAPITGIMLAWGPGKEVVILHPFVELRLIVHEKFTVDDSGNPVEGAGIETEIVREDLGAFVMSRASLGVLYKELKAEFDPPIAQAP